MSPPTCPRTALVWAAMLVALGLALPSFAHDLKNPTAGTQLLIDTTGPQPEFVLQADDVILIAGADPRSESSAVIVRSLDGSQSTGAIALDRNRWTSTVEDSLRIYSYSDPSGSRGGIRAAELRSGSLRIEGGGASFTLSPSGTESGFEVIFRIESEWICSEFAAATGASVDAQGAGLYSATNAPRPPSCEPEFCGNGVKESAKPVTTATPATTTAAPTAASWLPAAAPTPSTRPTRPSSRSSSRGTAAPTGSATASRPRVGSICGRARPTTSCSACRAASSTCRESNRASPSRASCTRSWRRRLSASKPRIRPCRVWSTV